MKQHQIERKARDLSNLIGELGDSPQVRIARARIDEAAWWTAQHLAAADSGCAFPPDLRRRLLDIFDRIAAAIAAKQGGDTTALQEHISAIDAHLSQLDQADTDEGSRLTSIEAGLQKVADAVNPPAPADASADQPTT